MNNYTPEKNLFNEYRAYKNQMIFYPSYKQRKFGMSQEILDIIKPFTNIDSWFNEMSFKEFKEFKELK